MICTRANPWRLSERCSLNRFVSDKHSEFGKLSRLWHESSKHITQHREHHQCVRQARHRTEPCPRSQRLRRHGRQEPTFRQWCKQVTCQVTRNKLRQHLGRAFHDDGLPSILSHTANTSKRKLTRLKGTKFLDSMSHLSSTEQHTSLGDTALFFFTSLQEE